MLRAAMYMRVSTEDQTTENQRAELLAVAAARRLEVVATYEETESGASDNLPELERLVRDARRGRAWDVLLIWSLDRLGRTLWREVDTVRELDRLGVNVISYTEPWLDTGGPARELLLLIFAWVAQQERTRLVERTRAGLERARRQGKALGRPRRDVDLRYAHDQLAAGRPLAAIARAMGISSSTLERRLRADRQKGGVEPAPALPLFPGG